MYGKYTISTKNPKRVYERFNLLLLQKIPPYQVITFPLKKFLKK